MHKLNPGHDFKIGYATRQQAETARDTLFSEKGRVLFVYECGVCGKWHLGRRQGHADDARMVRKVIAKQERRSRLGELVGVIGKRPVWAQLQLADALKSQLRASAGHALYEAGFRRDRKTDRWWHPDEAENRYQFHDAVLRMEERSQR